MGSRWLRRLRSPRRAGGALLAGRGAHMPLSLACAASLALWTAPSGAAPSASSPSPARSSAHLTTSPVYVSGTLVAHDAGPVTAPVTSADLGITLGPPRAGAAATITPSEAMARCHVDAPCDDDAVVPRFVVAEVSARDPSVLGAEGTSTPLYVDRLAYVVEWSGVACSPTGAPTDGSSPAPTPAPSRCSDLDVIDALSGAFLFGESSSRPLRWTPTRRSATADVTVQ